MGVAERVATGTEEPCPTILTQRSIEQQSISPAHPNELVSITSKCHRNAGCTVWYCWADGCAVLLCAKCEAGVARMLLAVDVPS